MLDFRGGVEPQVGNSSALLIQTLEERSCRSMVRLKAQYFIECVAGLAQFAPNYE